ncbi:KilA-N domain-containing protein [Acinetobacter sp. B10A]|uniref:KilA-N domain-containing protein n=1 Tax=Acinetobacter baretiae TaxID=2605383 RepID=UPI001B3C5206|nr:KilA-N domain-containing protein [Acinetobacter baretiae]MBF7685959.1 KilA-N domain-containing protein [Acinetobacter baretiae]
MSNLTQNRVSTNTQPLAIGDFSIRQDEDGRYCLHDLHKASGGAEKHQPAFFVRNKQTKDLVAEIESENHSANLQSAIKSINGGKNRGTYVVKEIVYAYAMWISAKFHLTVIRAYDAMVMQWQMNDRKSISPEQQALLHEIVDRRSKGERKIYAEMWSRHNRHFKIPRYSELLAIHFEDAVKYLEEMVIKSKVEQAPKFEENEMYEKIRSLIEAILSQNGMMNDLWKALELMCPRDMRDYARYIIRSNELAREVSIDLNYQTKQGLPLIDGYCRTINFSTGIRMGVNPKWFNAQSW